MRLLSFDRAKRVIRSPLMPLIELLILIFAGGTLVMRAVETAPGRLDELPLGLAVLALAGQLGLEGSRWQLAPAYLVVAILVSVGVWRWLTNEPDRQVLAWISWGLIAATLAAVT